MSARDEGHGECIARIFREVQDEIRHARKWGSTPSEWPHEGALWPDAVTVAEQLCSSRPERTVVFPDDEPPEATVGSRSSLWHASIMMPSDAVAIGLTEESGSRLHAEDEDGHEAMVACASFVVGSPHVSFRIQDVLSQFDHDLVTRGDLAVEVLACCSTVPEDEGVLRNVHCRSKLVPVHRIAQTGVGRAPESADRFFHAGRVRTIGEVDGEFVVEF